MMLSEDYKVRLKAEYQQLLIRYEQLINYVLLIRIGKVESFKEEDLDLYEKQLDAMKQYLLCLRIRCKTNKIKI